MTTKRWPAGLLAAAAVGVALLAGCSGLDSGGDAAQDAGGEAAPAPAPEEAPADGADRGGADDSGAVGEPGGAGGQLVDPRSIIYTGQLVVRVDEVVAAADRAGTVAARHGGFVGGDRRLVDEAYSMATLTLRVPSENFAAAVNDLAELGEEESREIYTEDVTAEVVDLDVRIATARASVVRTRALLEEAESIADIVAVEEELTRRESTLAQLEARQRTLADLTTLSTITVEFLGPEAEPDVEEEETGFLAGLRGGWNAFTTSLTVLVTVLGALLPFLVAFGVPVAALLWWARRRRRAAPGVPAAAQEGTPTGP